MSLPLFLLSVDLTRSRYFWGLAKIYNNIYPNSLSPFPSKTNVGSVPSILLCFCMFPSVPTKKTSSKTLHPKRTRWLHLFLHQFRKRSVGIPFKSIWVEKSGHLNRTAFPSWTWEQNIFDLLCIAGGVVVGSKYLGFQNRFLALFHWSHRPSKFKMFGIRALKKLEIRKLWDFEIVVISISFLKIVLGDLWIILFQYISPPQNLGPWKNVGPKPAGFFREGFPQSQPAPMPGISLKVDPDLREQLKSRCFFIQKWWNLPSLKLTNCTWKWMVGIRSFPFGARPIFRCYVNFRESNGFRVSFLGAGLKSTHLSFRW